MMHAFLLMVYLGSRVVSQDMYFQDIDRCKYFAERLNNQPPVPNPVAQEDAPRIITYTAVCVPKRIGKNTKVY
jgi:hypothetical protein|tara:strand:- start:4 stop:222 length:219 start_codon:yes stop_codon:yes gene_type:complete